MKVVLITLTLRPSRLPPSNGMDRVIETALRQPPRCKSSGGDVVPSTGGHDREQELGYDAWVGFYLCEESLRAGEGSERDVKLCFDLADAAGVGRIGVNEVAPFYDDMVSPSYAVVGHDDPDGPKGYS